MRGRNCFCLLRQWRINGKLVLLRILARPKTMTEAPSKPLTPAAIAKRVDDTWQEVLQENKLVWSKADISKMLLHIDVPPETAIARGMTIGAAIGLTSAGKRIAGHIKSEEQLLRVLQEMRSSGSKIPSILRKASKEMLKALPRRGGPGRQPKLSPREASLMCDQIALFIRQKNSLKKSLQRASELSPSILKGKKVGSRTLQKAWDKRDEHGPQ